MRIKSNYEYRLSLDASNKLADVIRSGRATARQIAEYEARDHAEMEWRRTLSRNMRPFNGLTCDECGFMP